MDELDASHFEKCLRTLSRALALYEASGPEAEDAELYRSACVKEFELLVELAGKLLKKRLRPFFSSNLAADRLVYKDVFRHAARHGLLPLDVAERWLGYRDVRNQTAHDYGAGYADKALAVMSSFAADARIVHEVLISY
jgi:uncharacterized protein YutE (UPF0331/DUF86 family)